MFSDKGSKESIQEEINVQLFTINGQLFTIEGYEDIVFDDGEIITVPVLNFHKINQ